MTQERLSESVQLIKCARFEIVVSFVTEFMHNLRLQLSYELCLN